MTHSQIFLHMYINSIDKGFGSIMFQLLIGTVVLDFLLGTVRGISLKKINSTISVNGLAKHAMIVIVPMFLYPYIDLMGYGYFGDAIIGFLVLSQGQSLLENWIAIGLPFKPEWRQFFDEKKIEQKERRGTIHTDDPVPDENEKKL